MNLDNKSELSKVLLLDAGNSNVVFAKYLDSKPQDIRRVKTEYFKENYHGYCLEKYEKIIVSSVVPAVDDLISQYNTLYIDYKTIPVAGINLKKSDEVGADRLVTAFAAHCLFKKECLVIDSGTAVTFCYIDQKGVYQGGAIFPGMGIASSALEEKTAKIPFIKVKKISGLLGKTTREAVQTGLYRGYSNLINGMIREYKKLNPDVAVVGTGRGLEVLKDEVGLDYYEPHLVLKGLAFCADKLMNKKS
ncbi:MAG: type III pantothenate kinase [bacterium]|nr:type III pantothenate kinase [bacterium]